jgi:GNAT superfamily N-acetyltransferase
MSERRLPRARWSFHPLTADRWPDLVRLFGPRGACAGCWCMWPRRTAAEFRRGAGEGNRRALRRLVKSGEPTGVLAYLDAEPIGWCAVAPRDRFRRLERSRVMAPVDDRPVWSVVCFFVARGHRSAGLTPSLLEAAVSFAGSRGATLIEGYPLDPPAGRVADVHAWFGLAGAFRAAGFREVARRSPTRPLMRRAVRAVAPSKRARTGAKARG